MGENGALLAIKAGLPGPLGRLCRKCGADHWMYMKWKNGDDGARCAKCATSHSKRWKTAHPDKYREWSWKDRGINITVVEYNRLYEEQDGACAICAKQHGKLRVDHCHKTGKIRGLLCPRCNALAQDPDVLRLVLAYMEGG